MLNPQKMQATFYGYHAAWTNIENHLVAQTTLQHLQTGHYFDFS